MKFVLIFAAIIGLTMANPLPQEDEEEKPMPVSTL